jgi:hypothetical protein
VGVRQRLRQGPHDVDRVAQRERAFVHGLLQGVSLDIRRGNVVVRPVPTGVEDGDDVRVAQAGGGPGVAQEAVDALGVVERAGPRNLEGDVALQLRVISPVNSAEPPLAQPGADQEPADLTGQVGTARPPGRR